MGYRRGYKFVLLVSFAWLSIVNETLAKATGARQRSDIKVLESFFLWFIITLLSLFIAVGVPSFFYTRRKNSSHLNNVKIALWEMSERDPQWSEDSLSKVARQIFIDAQDAWSNQELMSLSELLHPELFTSWELHIKKLIANNERNLIKELSINQLRIVDVTNQLDEERATFSVCFDAQANSLPQFCVVGVKHDITNA